MRGDLKRLKTHNTRLRTSGSKQKHLTKPSTKATGFKPMHLSFQPIVDPQGSNLCDPETPKPYNTVRQANGFEPLPLAEIYTLKRALIKPKGLNLCHL